MHMKHFNKTKNVQISQKKLAQFEVTSRSNKRNMLWCDHQDTNFHRWMSDHRAADWTMSDDSAGTRVGRQPEFRSCASTGRPSSIRTCTTRSCTTRRLRKNRHRRSCNRLPQIREFGWYKNFTKTHRAVVSRYARKSTLIECIRDREQIPERQSNNKAYRLHNFRNRSALWERKPRRFPSA